jgi:ring-1,2-phenylacetyl-CoA epoxidase subunit PaaC
MATTSITLDETAEVASLLRLADDALIHGHRLSEWTGHAPTLEEELALANIALDLIGQARALYQLAGERVERTEDQLAYLRDQGQFRNALIHELPRGDFAFTIARLLFSATAADLFWREAIAGPHAELAAIAGKAAKETAYHVRHAAEWLVRLGDGTTESHRRTRSALDLLWPYVDELFEPFPAPFAPIPDRAAWFGVIRPVLARATLDPPADGWSHRGGRAGRHTEHLGRLLAEMQTLPRTFPGATW